MMKKLQKKAGKNAVSAWVRTLLESQA
jgi:hypothetical protein